MSAARPTITTQSASGSSRLAAAGKWLQPDALWVVIVGRAADIEPQIAKSGLPYERIDFKAPISYGARNRIRRQQEREAHPVLPAPK